MIRFAPVIGTITLFVAVCSSLHGQTSAPEYSIKAAYLYNFLRYVTWPDSAFDNGKSPYVVAVLGDAPLDGPLGKIAKTKTVNGRSIKAVRHKQVANIKQCHVLFLSKSLDAKVVKAAVKRFSDKPVLLVGESNDFIDSGGFVNFVIAEKRVKFQLALKRTRSQGLKPSAKLVQVATVVD